MKKTFYFSIFVLIMIYSTINARKLNILLTNDIHGNIHKKGAKFINPEYPPLLGGGATMAKYIEEVRKIAKANGEDVLLLDAGDIFQGAPIGTNSKGKAIIEYFNMVGYDAWTLGNHDFDLGLEPILKLIKISKAPVLSANVRYRDTGKLLEGVKPYIIIEKNGIRYGIIGVTTTETQLMTTPDVKKKVDFLPIIDVLNELVPKVRKEADIIIVLGHTGLPYNIKQGWNSIKGKPIDKNNLYTNTMQILRVVKGIDIYLGGHIHHGEKKPWVDPNTHTISFQTYALGSGMGHLIVDIDDKTKSIIKWEYPEYNSDLVTMFVDEFGTDPYVEAKIDSMRAIAEKGMDEVIGETERRLGRGGASSGLLGQVVCDAMREEANVDFAFINLGGLRDIIKAGKITYRDVFNVLPFSNVIVVMEVDGKTLLDILETRVMHMRQGLYVSGITYRFNRNLPDGHRTTKLLIGGKPWDPNKTYRIATTDFIAQGNLKLYMLSDIPQDKKYSTQLTLRDATVNYIRKHSPLNPKLDNRWKQDNNSQPTPELKSALKKMQK